MFTMEPMWGEWGNEILFQVRKHLPPVRLKPYQERSTCNLLEQDFFSPGLATRLKEPNLRLAIFYAWVLDHLPPPQHKKKAARAIDLGSMNFVYVPALCRFLRQRYESFELTGLEVDPYRTYVDLYKRGDYAQYYSDIAGQEFKESEVAYIPGNWLTWEPPADFDMVFCFFPFLFADLHKGWGLSHRHFSPRRFYEKIFHQSKEAIFFHQGREERDHSVKLIQSIGVGRIAHSFEVQDNPWVKRKHPVEVLHWSI